MASAADLQSFTSLANVQLPAPSRLVTSACCPDKDLVVLIQRLGSKDRLSLWKIQGSKKWEVSVEREPDAQPEEIIDVAWRQTIAVLHDPPRVTLHSIQDGHEQNVMYPAPAMPGRRIRLTNVWWFAAHKKADTDNIPDMFQRQGVITGSAHSTLKLLPLLDPPKDEQQSAGATELFAFQSTRTKTAQRSAIPLAISSWPTLSPDPLAASIAPSDRPGSKERSIAEELDPADDANVDGILAIADDQGRISPFLDGSFAFGPFAVDPTPGGSAIASLIKDSSRPVFYAHRRICADDASACEALPTIVHLPLMAQRMFRDEAKICSTARELVWYLMRSIKEMRTAWHGSDTLPGASGFGPRWERMLREKQQKQFGQKHPDAILDLTALLITGKASEALTDLLGSGGENMGDRGIMKWETIVGDALIKLRDHAERRVGPAFQRLHVVLEEVQGWALLPAYSQFRFSAERVGQCLELVKRGIILSAWLASAARQELRRFKEFMSWIKHELGKINTSGDAPNPGPAKHDILVVNDYLTAGLIGSPIDKWFVGPVPTFTTEDLGGSLKPPPLHEAIQNARKALSIRPLPSTLVGIYHRPHWSRGSLTITLQMNPRNIPDVDRNLDALIGELATSCQQLFVQAADAAGRSAQVSNVADVRPPPQSVEGKFVTRERTTEDADRFVQYLAIWTTDHRAEERHHRESVYRDFGAGQQAAMAVALLDCTVAKGVEGSDVAPFDVLDADFFDEELVVIVYRLRDSAWIGMANYREVSYQDIERARDDTASSREGLFVSAVRKWREGEIRVGRVSISRARRLAGRQSGGVSLAVNGRKGRRVACVLGGEGSTLEMLDMEGDEMGEEAEEGDALA
ncbi:hypothetical protein PUNSTDRAFT_59241 [Punctularia strigosozonata HHB-11173 SS5]|uniref:uncharacterized protein n=1 Tax=Punctularia strigosozonata (strain HHB-11173) TaxID=741275 RepID=UPI00044183F8|nr:uncharacterized protein PUNSTDRAFT_59241 [Punctularia strigosozonata HHB-11173 SS5]EIN13727.1 hypothetical protein PUNSTDRAFT_59241 [Punctularia strigosozonata HHB-11173 SS5]